jgi:hypothetical protein
LATLKSVSIGGCISFVHQREIVVSFLLKCSANSRLVFPFSAKENNVSDVLEYIHNNPVEAGIEEKAEEYIYSSARDYYYGKQCELIKIEYLL